MKNIKNFNGFNEGKISQFVLKNLFVSIGEIKSIIKRIKGTYIPVEFKDKKMSKSFTNKLFQLFDYIIFDCLKYRFSKKQKEIANKTSLSDLIEKKSGVNVYLLADSILEMLKVENIQMDDFNKIKVLKFIEDSTSTIRKMIAIIKRVDDEIEDEQQFRRDLAELSEMFKSLDPRRPHRDRDETLGALARAKGKLDEMEEPKELDNMLDKISKYGMDSLTSQERIDLEKRSK